MTYSNDDNSRRLRNAARRSIRAFSLCLASVAISGCASTESEKSEVGVASQALEGVDCGYAVAANVKRVTKKGFRATIKITNGGRLMSTGFTVLVKAGAATLDHVGHGSFQAVEGGYLLSSNDLEEDCDDLEDDEKLDDPDILMGKAYRFHLKFKGPYTALTANIISSSGANCDQTAPTVKLTTSGDLFTSNNTLTLSADASDNVAVGKVVFAQDGVEIGTDRTAPYTLNVPVTNVLNGRHRYTATAYDLTGNQASETKRVLVAIGNKFFGTAATTAADYPGLLSHFNQITPGNAGKWGSVEATYGQMNWTDLDTAYNFAKSNNIPFKMHTLVWGQQQPAWLAALPADQQLAEIDNWMAAVAARYPNIALIDVVNEPLHAVPSYAAALGGAGATGWDWVIKAFEMARAHFPNSELLINDYSILTMASTTQNYLTIINLLKDRGLVDGIGEQGHFYERAPELSSLTANLNALTATGLPVYISELDLNLADDALQANRMRDLFATLWSNPSVLGITHWGYLQGNMWQPNAYLVRTDGSSRPALTFIECFKAGGTNCTVPVYVPQPRTGDVNSITVQAEEYDAAHAVLPAGNVVAYASDGSWLGYNKVVFNDNWNTLSVTYALGGTTPINLTVHLDSLDNAPVATVLLAPTGGWGTSQTVAIPWAPIGDSHDLFVRFNGGGANIDKFQFAAPSGTGKNIIADNDFELGTKDGWSSWAAGTIANTTARAVSGTHSLAMTGRTGNSPLAENLTSLVVPGKTYKVSLWGTVGAVASASAYVTTAIKCVPDSATTYGRLGGWGNTKTITDGTWVEFSGDLVVPDCQLDNVSIWLEGPGAAVDLYIDHASVRQQSSNNVINNGTFESGTSGWYTWGGATLSASAARAHGGAKSLLVDGRTGNAPAATDVTSVVKAGTNYPFSLWVSIHVPDATSKTLNVTQAASCILADGTVSTAYNWIAGPVTVADGATWTQISGTVAVPNCNLKQLQFWVEGTGPDQIYVDDVQVLDLSGGTSNLITDGTFETGQGAWGGWGYTSLAVVSTTAHSGAQSLMGSGMTQNSAISRDIKSLVIPGKRYQATTWVTVGNLDAGSGSVKFQTVQSCNASGTDSYPWLAGATVTNGVWSQITGTVDLTACTTIEKLQLFVGADLGNLYLDDVTLTAMP